MADEPVKQNGAKEKPGLVPSLAIIAEAGIGIFGTIVAFASLDHPSTGAGTGLCLIASAIAFGFFLPRPMRWR